ncbi:MAG: hypothetical protein MJK18_01600, partial [Bdellovibrionales bacterium]|nr:hypothetical protein [Bdellovibrionales bacterium]
RSGQCLQQMIYNKVSQGSLLFSEPKDEPFIALRSDWSLWLGLKKRTVYGLRKKRYLFTFEPEMKVYDSSIESRELEPLEKKAALALAQKYDMAEKVKNHFNESCLYDSVREQIAFGFSELKCNQSNLKLSYTPPIETLSRWSEKIWNFEGDKKDVKLLLSENGVRQSLILQGWLAQQALVERDWDALSKIASLSNSRFLQIVALKNKGDVFVDKPKGCMKYFMNSQEPISDFYKKCENSSLRKVVEGIYSLKSKQKPAKSFWQQVYRIKSVRFAKDVNLKMHFINDVKRPFEFTPTLAELYFYLPENKEYLNLININES